MARIVRRFVGHLGEAHPVQNEKTQQRRHDCGRSPLRGKRRICSQNRYQARHITLRVVVRDCADVPTRFRRTAHGPGGWQVSWLADYRPHSRLPGFPVAEPAKGPLRNGNSPLTVAGAATDLPNDRAHRRSLFISPTGEPSVATVNEKEWRGQSNARRKTFRKSHSPACSGPSQPLAVGELSDEPPNRESATIATKAITASAAITIPAGRELIRRRVI